MRRLKLPNSFPRLSFGLSGISFRQAIGPSVATAMIVTMILMFSNGGLRLNWRSGSSALTSDTIREPSRPLPVAERPSTVPANSILDTEENATEESFATLSNQPSTDATPHVLSAFGPSVAQDGIGEPTLPATLVSTSLNQEQSVLPLSKDSASLRLVTLRLHRRTTQRFVPSSDIGVTDVQHWFDEISSTFCTFDLVIIQGFPLALEPELHQWINRQQIKPRWNVLSGDPDQLHTDSEHVIFMWDQERLHCPNGRHYLVSDPSKRFAQPPMVAGFEARISGSDGRQPFRFTIIHTVGKPNNEIGSGVAEILSPAQKDLFRSVSQFEFENHGEDDLLLVGDGLVTPRASESGGKLPESHWVKFASSFINEKRAGALGRSSDLGFRERKEVGPTLQIAFDRYHTNEFLGASNRSIRPLALSSELGIESLLWLEFAAFESVDFETVATQPEKILNR